MSRLLPFPYQPWRELYIAALFEDNQERLAHLVAQARSAAVKRSRELFHQGTPDCNDERQALDNALHFLDLIEATRKNARLAA